MSDVSVHFSSATSEWGSPQELFDKANAEFNFSLDVCAVPENAKCARYFTPEIDGLSQNWTGMCWMNPPYGREIGKWIKKAYESALSGDATVVCLIPARTDSRWFVNYCTRGEIRFFSTRLSYQGRTINKAPFPSALVIFHAYLDPGGIVKWNK